MTSPIKYPQLGETANRILSEVTGPTTPMELADKLNMSRRRVANYLARYAQAGYIRRPCWGVYAPLDDA